MEDDLLKGAGIQIKGYLMNKFKKDYDVVLYFCGCYKSHLHKYLSLHRSLSKHCNSLLILSNSVKWGVDSNFLKTHYSESLSNVISTDDSSAFDILSTYDYKLGVFGCSFRKGNINYSDIDIAKKRKIKTLQITETPLDFYYGNSDIVSLISPYYLGLTDKGWECEEKIFSNALLWDNIDTCLPYKLSKIEFCEKYNLDPDRRILMWCPSSAHSHPEKTDPKFGKRQQDVYRYVCNLDNVIVKLHPNEYRRHKSHILDNRWTYELYADKKVSVLDELDGHWAMTYLDYLISYQSSIGPESALYKKPCIHINVDEDNLLFAKNQPGRGLSAWEDKYIWAGSLACNLENLNDLVDSGFQLSNQEYEDVLDILLWDKNKSAVELLTEQILERIY